MQSAEVRGLGERLRAVEESLTEGEDRLRVQITTNSSLTSTNAKLNSQIHAMNNEIVELRAVSIYFFSLGFTRPLSFTVDSLSEQRSQSCLTLAERCLRF